MRCVYLTGNYLKSCSACREVYVPGPFVMEEYCAVKRHSRCPFYRQRTFNGSQAVKSGIQESQARSRPSV